MKFSKMRTIALRLAYKEVGIFTIYLVTVRYVQVIHPRTTEGGEDGPCTASHNRLSASRRGKHLGTGMGRQAAFSRQDQRLLVFL